MSRLIHGSQTINIGMMQIEDRVKSRSRDKDHVAPNLDVDGIMYVLEVA
jgi:hypothetical protein